MLMGAARQMVDNDSLRSGPPLVWCTKRKPTNMTPKHQKTTQRSCSSRPDICVKYEPFVLSFWLSPLASSLLSPFLSRNSELLVLPPKYQHTLNIIFTFVQFYPTSEACNSYRSMHHHISLFTTTPSRCSGVPTCTDHVAPLSLFTKLPQDSLLPYHASLFFHTHMLTPHSHTPESSTSSHSGFASNKNSNP